MIRISLLLLQFLPLMPWRATGFELRQTARCRLASTACASRRLRGRRDKRAPSVSSDDDGCRASPPVSADDEEEGLLPDCALCGRPIPRDVRQSVHHLVPKLKGGAKGATVLLHQICHNEVHASLSETELAREFHTPEALRAHPRLATFVRFVASKPPDFYTRSERSERRKR